MAKPALCRITMDGKMFVLLAVPEVDEVEDVEDYLRDFLEVVLDAPVDCFVFNRHVPYRVLVTMMEVIDLAYVACEIAKTPFEGQTLTVESPDMASGLIVTSADRLHEFTLNFMKSYFEKEYANGEEVVSSSFLLPPSKMSVFTFTDIEVMQRVMKCKEHLVPFPEKKYAVVVEPCFHNFHGLIPVKDKLLNDLLEGVRNGIYIDAGTLPIALTDGKVNGTPSPDSRLSQNFISVSEMDISEPQTSAVLNKTTLFEEGPQTCKIYNSILLQNEEVVFCDREQGVLKYLMSESEWKLLRSRMCFQGVTFEYECDKALLVVKGKNVSDFLKNLKWLQSRIHHKSESMDEDTHILMMSQNAKDYLTSQFPDVQWHFQDRCLDIYAFNMSVVEEFSNKIRHLKVDLGKAALKNFSEEKSLRRNYAERLHVVQMSSNAEETVIMGVQKRTIAVFEKPKLCSFGEESFAQSSRWSDIETIQRISFEFSDLYFKFVCAHHKNELDQALTCVASSSVSSKSGKVFMELSGDMQAIKKACDILKTLLRSIKIQLETCQEYFAKFDVF